MIDQPRISRGRRGLGAYSFNAAVPDDCSWTTFRYGIWFPPAQRTFFPGVQLARDPASVAALCQLSGSAGGPPFTAAETSHLPANAVLDLLNKKAGDTVLVTHSAGGIRGFLAKSLDQNNKVKGIVAYEPAEFIWPVGQMAPWLPTAYDGTLFPSGIEVPLADFQRLLTIPIQIVWGDNIPTQPTAQLPGPERWRLRNIYAQQFVDLINSMGGNAEILKLPEIGVHGNTHFPFFDLNNEKIADLMVDFLKKAGLDKH